MASSSKGLRLIKALEILAKTPYFDATTVLKKVNIQSASNGNLKGSFKIEPMMCNIADTLHGGYIASVIDVLSLYSQLSHPDGRLSWTSTIDVTFIKTAEHGETVNVETNLLRSGRAPIVETHLHSGDGSLLAKGIVTFIDAGDKYQQKFIDKFSIDLR